ncbi:three-Cys-motif partner protein TcmP [Nonomuraea sp. NPDC005501]|uniref:three-Cys-motif partner protein TcmP n=1 Tax=Nonomuraea sp. NPDC005501 TaxID=3156884 RepID=UPI0033A26ECF
MTANDDFFRERQAAAVFKHGILKRYPVVFASKAGSRVPDRRVVFVDGYAGRGRYEDGSPGSPLLLAQGAASVSDFRNVTGIFVERDAQNYDNLERVLAEQGGQGMPYLLYKGDLGSHVPVILDKAKGSALLAFLDPFGTALDSVELQKILTRGGPSPTEVLLHFSVSAVSRLGPVVRKLRVEKRAPSDDERKKIARLDRFLGGTWWQPHFAELQHEDLGAATKVALSVADNYRDNVRRATGFQSVSIQVRMKPDNLPKYILVLFTRSPEGIWQFADALGKAGLEWHEAWRSEIVLRDIRKNAAVGQDSLFGDECETSAFDRKAYLKAEEPKWVAAIERNILDLLGEYSSFKIIDHVDRVYGTTLGSAWIPHLRKAVKGLYAQREITVSGVGDFQKELIRRIAS